MRLVVVVFGLMLTGCAGSPVRTMMSSPEQLAQEDDAKCRDFGATPGTQAYFDCRMAQEARRDARMAEYRQSIDDGLSEEAYRQDAFRAQQQAALSQANNRQYDYLSSGVRCVSKSTFGLGNPVVTECR